MSHTCIVCGYDELYEPPKDKNGVSSDEICPCCGFHYGFDDDDNPSAYDHWRSQWKGSNYKWFSKSRRPPDNWNHVQQINKIL